jgi:hypothetical protein
VAVIKGSVFHVLEKFPERAMETLNGYTEKTRNFKPSVTITVNAPRPCTTGIDSHEKDGADPQAGICAAVSGIDG